MGGSSLAERATNLNLFYRMFLQPNYSTKQKENYLINACLHSHDLLCDCNDGTYHMLMIFTKNIGSNLPKQQKYQIQKCLGDHTAATEKDIDFGEDLETIFADDTTKEDADG